MSSVAALLADLAKKGHYDIFEATLPHVTIEDQFEIVDRVSDIKAYEILAKDSRFDGQWTSIAEKMCKKTTAMGLIVWIAQHIFKHGGGIPIFLADYILSHGYLSARKWVIENSHGNSLIELLLLMCERPQCVVTNHSIASIIHVCATSVQHADKIVKYAHSGNESGFGDILRNINHRLEEVRRGLNPYVLKCGRDGKMYVESVHKTEPSDKIIDSQTPSQSRSYTVMTATSANTYEYRTIAPAAPLQDQINELKAQISAQQSQINTLITALKAI